MIESDSYPGSGESVFAGPLAAVEFLVVAACILLSVIFVRDAFFWLGVLTAASTFPAVFYIMQHKVGLAAALLSVPVGLTVAILALAQR